jgi:hypothetical protein
LSLLPPQARVADLCTDLAPRKLGGRDRFDVTGRCSVRRVWN